MVDVALAPRESLGLLCEAVREQGAGGPVVEVDPGLARAGLRRGEPQPAVRAPARTAGLEVSDVLRDLLPDVQDAALQVDVGPPQPEQLAAAQPGQDGRLDEGAEPVGRGDVEQVPDLLGLERAHLRSRRGRQRGVRGGVVGDELVPGGVGERAAQGRPDPLHGRWRQPAVGANRGQHVRHVRRAQVREAQLTEVRHEVVTHVLGVGADRARSGVAACLVREPGGEPVADGGRVDEGLSAGVAARTSSCDGNEPSPAVVLNSRSPMVADPMGSPAATSTRRVTCCSAASASPLRGYPRRRSWRRPAVVSTRTTKPHDPWRPPASRGHAAPSGRPPDGPEWKIAIRTSAISAHAVLLHHPWACNLAVARPRISPAKLRLTDATVRTLRSSGFSLQLAHNALHAIDGHIYGFTLQELSMPADLDELGPEVSAMLRHRGSDDYSHIAEMFFGSDHDDQVEFKLVLDLILDGLERIRDSRVAPTTRG